MGALEQGNDVICVNKTGGWMPGSEGGGSEIGKRDGTCPGERCSLKMERRCLKTLFIEVSHGQTYSGNAAYYIKISSLS